MLGPMISLARGAAIPGMHTRLAHLETDASLLAALGAAAGSRIFMIIHFKSPNSNAVSIIQLFFGGSRFYFSSFFAAFVTYCHLIVSTALSLNNNHHQPIRSIDNDVVTRQQLLQQSSSLFSATTAAAILAASTSRPANAAASTTTTSTAGGGLARRLSSRDPGQLTNRIFNIPPKTPQIYPPFARGVWDVAMTFSGYTFPSTTIPTNQLISNSDVPGFQKLSIAMLGDVGKATSSYILDIDTSTGYENRILSYTSSITSHLGYDAVREIKYNPKDNSPNRLS